jgi:prolyl 4-hydroxylase
VPAAALPAPISGRTTLSESPVLDVLHDFLTPAEAAHIIQLAEGRFKRSPVIDSKTGAQGTDPDRTSFTVFLQRAETPIVAAIEARAAAAAGVPVSHLERTQVVRYEPGQFYRPHHDYLKGRADEVAARGQRTVTVFAYLNDLPREQESGGGTRFPELGITVRPACGSAALWHNMTPDGAVDPRTLHGGDPVHKLTKYGMNLWFRELPMW